MILMSDGHSSSTETVLNKIVAYNETYKNNKIQVCTIGFGSGADHNLLSDIAEKTDCSYQYAANLLDLYFTYRSFQMEVNGEDMLKLSNKIRIIKEEIIRQFVFVDSTVGTTTFAMAWEGSDLDLTLIRPDGTTIDHNTNDLDIEFVEGDTYEFYKINAPMHGEWEMVIEAIDVPEGGEDFIITVSGENAMIFEANLNKPKYIQNEPVIITAFAQDPIMDTDDPQYVSEASFEVETTTPNQETSVLQLYDDGNHNDGEADDGIYANTFNDTQASGSYTFNVKASGKTNRAGDPFTREKSISTFVAENQAPTANANGPYTGYPGIKIIFDASNSTDSKNQPLQYRWDFNNDNIFETDWLINSTTEYTYYNSYQGEVLLEVSNGTLTNTDTAEVNIKSAKQLKKETIENLNNVKTGQPTVDIKIRDINKEITNILRDAYWQDENHLHKERGKQVFYSELRAIKLLNHYLQRSEKILQYRLPIEVSTAFYQAIDDLSKADEILSLVSLNEAKNTPVNNQENQQEYTKAITNSEKKIEDAQKYVKQYKQYGTPSRIEYAINYFSQAWGYARDAMGIGNL